ncbi:MAG TPA: DinB family protein [Longimicrobiaceae bacterium]|nr:DinB family protein [Longimicrobiaceae bacterium]
MTDTSTLINDALVLWADVREGVIEEIANIPEDEWNFRPAPGAWSVREIGEHIVESSLVFAGELARRESSFQRQTLDDFYREFGTQPRVRSKSELLAQLRDTFSEVEGRLRSLSDEHLLGNLTGFSGTSFVRLSFIHYGYAHEMHHCGQIALCARLLGLVPASTQRLRRMQQAAVQTYELPEAELTVSPT